MIEIFNLNIYYHCQRDREVNYLIRKIIVAPFIDRMANNLFNKSCHKNVKQNF